MVEFLISDSMICDTVPPLISEGECRYCNGMKVVGHKSQKMWKRYNSVEEQDLTHAAQKLNRYLKTNTVITPDQGEGEDRQPKVIETQVRP